MSSCTQLPPVGTNDGSLLAHLLIAALKRTLKAVQSIGKGTLYQLPEPATGVISTGAILCRQCSAFAEQS